MPDEVCSGLCALCLLLFQSQRSGLFVRTTRAQPLQILLRATGQIHHHKFRRVVRMPGQNEFFQRHQSCPGGLHHHQYLCAPLQVPLPSIMRLDLRDKIRARNQSRLQRRTCESACCFQIGRGYQYNAKHFVRLHACQITSLVRRHERLHVVRPEGWPNVTPAFQPASGSPGRLENRRYPRLTFTRF